MSATSRACRARGIWRTTRHTDKRSANHSRLLTDQSGKRVTCFRPTRPPSSRGCRRVECVGEDVTIMLRGCYEKTASVEFQRFQIPTVTLRVCLTPLAVASMDRIATRHSEWKYRLYIYMYIIVRVSNIGDRSRNWWWWWCSWIKFTYHFGIHAPADGGTTTATGTYSTKNAQNLFQDGIKQRH